MKCVKITGVKQLGVGEIDKPVSDGKRPVIKVESVGICGSDLHFWDDGQPVDLVMGHEFAGTVEDPGDRNDLKKGDRVVCLSVAPCLECAACKSGDTKSCTNKGKSPGIFRPENVGAYAEYFMPEKGEYLYKLPDTMSFDEATMVEPVAVTYHCFMKTDMKPGDNVLVTGGGLIGAMTMQWCKIKGAGKVYFTEPNAARAQKVLDMGYADVWLNGDAAFVELMQQYEAAPHYLQKYMLGMQMLATTGVPVGFDVIVEASAHHSALNLTAGLIRSDHTIVWEGARLHPFDFQSPVVLLRNAVIKGFLGFQVSDYEAAFKAVADGSFPVKQYQTGTTNLAGAQKAFEDLSAPGNNHFKIVMHPHE
ncbi:MAG: alcohol dehydrogenase catalytic domain-containing protein [Ruminococcaceae bacterium]|nr:alcohol dehydrogenase catalytic domain-containing protein [Oscillospiraceae bacterium]